MSDTIYVLDASVLKVMQNYFPASFATLWSDLEVAAVSGRAVSVEEVSKEIDRLITTPHVLEWRDKHKAFFPPPTSEEMKCVADIFKVPQFLGLVKKKNLMLGWPVADPWIVAKAKLTNGCVVTQEKLAQGGAKIPNVCAHFGVAVTNLEGMFEKEGWKY